MQLSHNLAEDLAMLLNNLLEQLQLFLACLDQELVIIEKCDFVALEASLHAKQALIDTMQVYYTRLELILKKAPLSDAIPTLSLDKKAPIESLYHQVKKYLTLCDQKNLANGITITRLRNINDALINKIIQRPQEHTYEKAIKNL